MRSHKSKWLVSHERVHLRLANHLLSQVEEAEPFVTSYHLQNMNEMQS